MDPLSQAAQTLGSPDVVVLTADDFAVIWGVVYRACEAGTVSEEERLRLSLVTTSDWNCPAVTVGA